MATVACVLRSVHSVATTKARERLVHWPKAVNFRHATPNVTAMTADRAARAAFWPPGSLKFTFLPLAGTNSLLPRDVYALGNWGVIALEDSPLILVVEDDQAVQSLVEEALSDGGFEPAIASSGEEAVTLLKEGKSKYRALMTDINLGRGKMDGWEVARHAREIDPEFPIVYMTGDSAGEWASKGVPNSIVLTKPFAPAQLVTAVSQLLIIGTATT
jgi:CheY-like chemotaxis protein